MEGPFLDLLAQEAPADAFETPLRDAERAGANPERIELLRRLTVQALQVRAVLDERRRRENELAALYATAGDLTSLRDVDLVLRAIVRRARQLLGTDTAYLMLIDEQRREAYMRVTDGTVTREYEAVRLDFGAGLGGLVAKTATPYFTSDYHADHRFDHVAEIDDVVAKEGISAILGVPLTLRERVIGVLFASERRVRAFTPHEVALLSSLGAHAALALENARLFEEAQDALRELNEVTAQLRAHTTAVEQAAAAHERFTALVLSGGGVHEVAAAVVDSLGGALLVVDAEGRVLADAGDSGDELHRLAVDQGSLPRAAGDEGALRRALLAAEPAERGKPVDLPAGYTRRWVARVQAGADRLGALLLAEARPLDDASLRTLERAALVTAVVRLQEQSMAEAEQRVRGELLGDLLTAGSDLQTLRARADLVGVDLAATHTVVVAAAPADARRRAATAAAALAAGQGGLGGLGGEHLDRVVLLLPGLGATAAAELVVNRLAVALDTRVTAGAQGPVAAAALPAAHRDAERCVRLLLALGRDGAAAAVEDLGAVALLFSESSAADLAAFVERTVGPVLAYDRDRGSRLLETLEAYFAAGGNLRRTAAALHVHVNTLYQRLERVGELLGDGWQEADAALDVQLAVRLHRLRSS